MVNCIIKKVEMTNCRNNKGLIDRYRILVEFNADITKPFRMKILSANLKDVTGKEIPADNKTVFPIGIINYIKPKYYFQSNGKPLQNNSEFSIAIWDNADEKPLRFHYIFEDGIGKMNKMEIWNG